MVLVSIFAVLLGGTFVRPTRADPLVPDVGHGTVKLESKTITSDRVFSGSFGTATAPSKTRIVEHRLEFTGVRGLGGPWAVEFDLRAAQESRTHRFKTTSGDAFQEQQLTVVRRQSGSRTFADGVGLDFVVIPGAAATAGAHYALEPQYQLATRRAEGTFARLTVGPRFFLGGHGTQLRLTGAVGTRLLPALSGEVKLSSYNVLGPKVSGYLVEDNLLRGGFFLKAARGRLRPELGYERDFAGQRQHAQQRIDFAMSAAF